MNSITKYQGRQSLSASLMTHADGSTTLHLQQQRTKSRTGSTVFRLDEYQHGEAGWRAFKLVKLTTYAESRPADGEEYFVEVRVKDGLGSCTCIGHERGGYCRHHSAIAQLILEGQLPDLLPKAIDSVQAHLRQQAADLQELAEEFHLPLAVVHEEAAELEDGFSWDALRDALARRVVDDAYRKIADAHGVTVGTVEQIAERIHTCGPDQPDLAALAEAVAEERAMMERDLGGIADPPASYHDLAPHFADEPF